MFCLLSHDPGHVAPAGQRSRFVHRAFHTEHGPRRVFELLRAEESPRPDRTLLWNRTCSRRPGRSKADAPFLLPLIDCHLVAFVEGEGDYGHWKIARDGERTRVDYFRFTEPSRATRVELEGEADRAIDRLLKKLKLAG